MPVKIVLWFLQTASLLLFPFGKSRKIVNIEEKWRTLNFQRIHFPMELQATQFLWNEGP